MALKALMVAFLQQLLELVLHRKCSQFWTNMTFPCAIDFSLVFVASVKLN